LGPTPTPTPTPIRKYIFIFYINFYQSLIDFLLIYKRYKLNTFNWIKTKTFKI